VIVDVVVIVENRTFELMRESSDGWRLRIEVAPAQS
jgi:hypothetical protein